MLMLNKSVVIFVCLFFGNDNNDEKTNDHQETKKERERENTQCTGKKEKRATTITM